MKQPSILILIITLTQLTYAQSTLNKPIDPVLLSTTVTPSDDFFEYVNSIWISQNPIPADKSRYGSFDILDENSLTTLQKVMSNASQANATSGTNTQKVADFWYSAMDTASIEAAGINPLQPRLEAIENIKTTDDVIRHVARMHRNFNMAMFSFWVQQDPMNSTEQIFAAWQGGLGLPDRDYYLLTDAKSHQIRSNYRQHIINVFKLIGENDTLAAVNADKIIKIETELAKSSMTRTQMRDPYAVYHKMTKEELQTLTPNINWQLYFSELKAPPFSGLNVAQTEFFTTLNAMLPEVKIDDWKTYLMFHLVEDASPYLSSSFVNEHFDFYDRKLSGIQQMKPRWKYVVENADYALGEALGQEYIKVAFSPESKQRMNEMINNLKISMGERIQKLDWMSDSTKQFAMKKLESMKIKIGYPEKWRDYTSLTIDRGAYVTNVMRASEFEAQRQLNKIGQPVDKTEWMMTPQTVNAYYDPSNNEIVFPAAILQPPFFDPNADDAINYGAIGAVIGHEITHGFDDEGRQFDAEGNLRQWWTDTDDKLFRERANVVVEHYNKYCPLDSNCINGGLTLGENIADFGGLTVAYYAFMKTEQAKSGQIIDGFTPQQRFFLGFARIWAGAYNNDAMRNQLLTNPHSPGKWRVNGVVMNMPEWYQAFNIKPGDKMYREEMDRARIW
jgi:putative endopeptidase